MLKLLLKQEPNITNRFCIEKLGIILDVNCSGCIFTLQEHLLSFRFFGSFVSLYFILFFKETSDQKLEHFKKSIYIYIHIMYIYFVVFACTNKCLSLQNNYLISVYPLASFSYLPLVSHILGSFTTRLVESKCEKH